MTPTPPKDEKIYCWHCSTHGRFIEAEKCFLLQKELKEFGDLKKLCDRLADSLEKTLAALVSYKKYTPEPYKQNPIYIIGSHEAEKESIEALAEYRRMAGK